MAGITPPKLTTKSFSVCYYDGNTGIPIEMISIINKTGAVKNTEQIAIDRKPDYDGLLIWDMNLIEEEEPIAGKKRNVKGFSNTGNLKTPTTNEAA